MTDLSASSLCFNRLEFGKHDSSHYHSKQNLKEKNVPKLSVYSIIFVPIILIVFVEAKTVHQKLFFKLRIISKKQASANKK
jgi:hypothetical protein